MKCTLVISDWEMKDNFFDYLKGGGTISIDINDKKCLVDRIGIEYLNNEPCMKLICHRSHLSANE